MTNTVITLARRFMSVSNTTSELTQRAIYVDISVGVIVFYGVKTKFEINLSLDLRSKIGAYVTVRKAKTKRQIILEKVRMKNVW